MSYDAQYVNLPDDKTAHIIGDGQRTLCNEPIPYNSDWTRDEPDKVCAKCRKAQDADPS